MTDLDNICSHAPIVLTEKGKAEMVIQDAEDVEAIREGLLQAQAGQGRSADEFFADFEARHGL